MAVRMNPYVVLNGSGRKAVEFYEKALDAKVVSVQTFGEAPSDPNHPLSADVKDRIMHALLKVGDTDLMMCDTFPGMPYETGNHVSIALVTDTVDATKRYFNALAEGGRVTMPLQETFWSPAYGMVTDKFGVAWQVTTETKG